MHYLVWKQKPPRRLVLSRDPTPVTSVVFRRLRGWDTVSKGRFHEVFLSGRFSLGPPFP